MARIRYRNIMGRCGTNKNFMIKSLFVEKIKYSTLVMEKRIAVRPMSS